MLFGPETLSLHAMGSYGMNFAKRPSLQWGDPIDATGFHTHAILTGILRAWY